MNRQSIPIVKNKNESWKNTNSPRVNEYIKPLISAFAVVSTSSHWARVVGYDPFSLCVIHKEGLCPSSGVFNKLMIMNEYLA
jgi:hypothetical protein